MLPPAAAVAPGSEPAPLSLRKHGLSVFGSRNQAKDHVDNATKREKREVCGLDAEAYGPVNFPGGGGGAEPPQSTALSWLAAGLQKTDGVERFKGEERMPVQRRGRGRSTVGGPPGRWAKLGG